MTASMRSTGSGSPMTPVEARKTSPGSQPSRSATARALASTASRPAMPVKALALPELTMIARGTASGRIARHQSTGAEAVFDRVKTPAMVVPGANSASQTSARLRDFIPAPTTLMRSPAISGSAGNDAGASGETLLVLIGARALLQLAVALLVFLAGAARARLVAAHLAALANEGLDRLGIAARLEPKPPFLGLGPGVAGLHRLLCGLGMLVFHLRRVRALALLHRLYLGLGAHLDAREDGGDVVAHPGQHLGEHLERLALVLLLGVLLRIAAQPDALSQVVHVSEMFLPLVVEHPQHDRLLEVAHDLGTDRLL